MNNRKKLYVSIGVILSVMMLVAIFAFRQEAQTNNANNTNQQEQDDPPTIVNRGQITNKQRVYSKAYKNYSNPNLTLSEGIKLADKENHKGEIVRSIIPEPNRSIGRFPVPIFFRYLACASNTIVLGSPQTKTAFLTEDESWVYTEYDFLVKEIFKNNSNNQFSKNDTIQITRTGGSVKLDNYIFRLKDEGIQQLKKNKDYLLFLRYVPETNGYVVASDFGDFVLNGNRLDSIATAPIPKTIKTNNSQQTIFSLVFSSLEYNCSQNSIGGN